MSEIHKNHQMIEDVREFRGHGADVGVDEIYKGEALRLALMDQDLRSAALREFDNKVNSYNENSNLRQKAQAFRFRQHLRTAHARLKLAGR